MCIHIEIAMMDISQYSNARSDNIYSNESIMYREDDSELFDEVSVRGLRSDRPLLYKHKLF